MTYQEVLDELIPDPAVQATINENNPVWTVDNNTFGSEHSFIAAINATVNNNSSVNASVSSEGFLRIFHPKGTAYGAYANAFLNAIQNHRGNAGVASASSTSAAPTSTATYIPRRVS
jgi:hypothetical protein